MAKDLMLVIDMQNVYASNGKWCCHATEDAAVNIKRVIREKPDLDVIFTRFLAPTEPRGAWQEYHRVNEDVNEDAFANEMLSRFDDELEKYPLYSKSTYSSLAIPEVRGNTGRACGDFRSSGGMLRTVNSNGADR